MVEKKSLFEKMGLLEPVEGKAINKTEESKKKVEFEKDRVLDDNIENKLDVLIGAYDKNKFLPVDEIYRNANLEIDKKKTIFMADVYLKALPENLPADIKRESVLNIMEATSIPVDALLNDAYKRIDSLTTVVEETVSTSESMTTKHQTTIKELESRIRELKNLIEERKSFEQEQNTSIEFEIQKIINIVDFVKPKK